MAIFNKAQSYGGIAKFFHWLLFLLIGGMIIFGYFLDDIPEAWSGFAYNTHKLLGLTILSLMLLRAFWSLINPKPLLRTTPFEYFIERSVHYSLYLVVLAMPIAGWIGSVAADHPPHWGNYVLTLPIEPDKALSKAAFGWHKSLAIALIALIALHFLAAMFHHFIRRDNVLKRMLPGSGR